MTLDLAQKSRLSWMKSELMYSTTSHQPTPMTLASERCGVSLSGKTRFLCIPPWRMCFCLLLSITWASFVMLARDETRQDGTNRAVGTSTNILIISKSPPTWTASHRCRHWRVTVASCLPTYMLVLCLVKMLLLTCRLNKAQEARSAVLSRLEARRKELLYLWARKWKLAPALHSRCNKL